MGRVRRTRGTHAIGDLEQNRDGVGFDSDKGIERFAADAKNPARMSTEWSRIGDPRDQMPKAASTMEAEYRCDYAYHAQMEPLERDRVSIIGR